MLSMLLSPGALMVSDAGDVPPMATLSHNKMYQSVKMSKLYTVSLSRNSCSVSP